jgi:hypothetical protein
MFKPTLAKALLGVAGLSLAGGTTALAAGPTVAAAQHAGAARPHRLATAQGVVVKVTDTELTISHRDRGADPAAKPGDDTLSFALTKDTAVYRALAPKDRLGIEALATGQRVRVAYPQQGSTKVARRVVILPAIRAGKLISKSVDGSGRETFKIQNRTDTFLVTVTPETRFFEGRRGRSQGGFTDMQVGQRVVVLGQADGNDSFDAATVRYWTPVPTGRKAPASTAKPSA